MSNFINKKSEAIKIFLGNKDYVRIEIYEDGIHIIDYISAPSFIENENISVLIEKFKMIYKNLINKADYKRNRDFSNVYFATRDFYGIGTWIRLGILSVWRNHTKINNELELSNLINTIILKTISKNHNENLNVYKEKLNNSIGNKIGVVDY